MSHQNFEDFISECEMHELLYYVKNELVIEEIRELAQNISSEILIPISDNLDMEEYILFLGDNEADLTIKEYLCCLNKDRRETILDNKFQK